MNSGDLVVKVAVPLSDEIEKQLAVVNFQDVVLDASVHTVFLRNEGAKIDLGAIAKGYGIDRGVSVLKAEGIMHFLLNAGGDIYVSGQKDEDTDWRVGVKHPRQLQELVAQFELKDYAVATSGDYERFTEIDGRRHHHILNPRTGYPGNLSQSATVLASTAEEADVLATCLFLMGADEALKKEKRPFLIVGSDGVVHYNAAFAAVAEVVAAENGFYPFSVFLLPIRDASGRAMSRPTKRPGMTAKPALSPALSPIMPMTQGVAPKPAMPKPASMTKSMVASTGNCSAASARMVGQKQAAANPAKTRRI